MSSLVGLSWWLKLYLTMNVTHNKGIWKYAKFVTNFKQQKFHLTTPHCSDSVTTWVTLQWLSDHMSYTAVTQWPHELHCSDSVTTWVTLQWPSDHMSYTAVTQWLHELHCSDPVTTWVTLQWLSDHMSYTAVTQWPHELHCSDSVTTWVTLQWLSDYMSYTAVTQWLHESHGVCDCKIPSPTATHDQWI